MLYLTTILLFLSSTVLATPSARTTTLIPTSALDTTASFEQYFTYNYPWGGTTHNGPHLLPSPLLSPPC